MCLNSVQMPVDETITGCIVNAVTYIVIVLIVLVVHFLMFWKKSD